MFSSLLSGVLMPALLALVAAAGLTPSTEPVAKGIEGAINPPSAAAAAPAKGAQPRNPRVLFITAKDCPRCEVELARLRRVGGDFEQMQARGWKIGAGSENHLQIVDADAVADLVRQLQVSAYPTVACINDTSIVRSFTSGCTTPLDAWTFGWLVKGIDERPAAVVPEAVRVETTGHYPLRGNHWSIEEDWSPTREKVVQHLRGPNHGSQINVGWKIESWSFEELRSLHDNLHEQEMGGVSYARGSSQSASNQFSATRKAGGH